MANIINTILTRSRAEGFRQTGQQVEELSKKQTRLANESTNTGRAFASQASGLGGLVAAYAGAAATLFALQQSFSALSAAARSEALVDGVTSLARSLGQDGPKIIQSLKSITREQLSITESAQNVGIALSAGLGAEQIEQLADIATKASKALGRDLTDSLQRLVRGVGKLEPELLDELGIFTRIDPAVERYAIRVGKAASSLTNFERRQAFANAVIEEGSLKYRNVDTSVSDTSQNLNRLAANLQDLALKIGQVLTTILNPIVEFFNKDVAGLAGLIAVLGSLIFSKLGQVSKEAVTTVTENIQRGASSISGFFLRASGDAGKFTASIDEAKRSIEGLNKNVLVGPRVATAETRKALSSIAAGPAPAEIPGISKTLQEQIARQQEATVKREKQLEKLRQTPIPADLDATKAAEATKKQADKISELEKKIASSKAATTVLIDANSKLVSSYQETGKATQIAGNAINGLGTAFGIAGRLIGGTITLLGRFAAGFAIVDFFLSLTGAIFGFQNPLNSAIAGLAKFFDSLFSNIRRTNQVREAFASSFVKESEAIKQIAGDAEVYAKALSNVRAAQRDIQGGLIETATRRAGLPDPQMDEITKQFNLAQQQANSLFNERTEQARQDTRTFAAPVADMFRSQSEIAASRQRSEAAQAIIDAEAKTRDATIQTALEKRRADETALNNIRVLEAAQDAYTFKIRENEKQLKTETDKLAKAKLLAEIALYKEAAKEQDAYLKGIIKNQGKVTQEILTNTDKLLAELTKKYNLSSTEAVSLVRRGIAAAGENNAVDIKAFDVFGQLIATYKSSLSEIASGDLGLLPKAAIEASVSIDKLNSAIASGSVSTDTLDGFIANLRKSLKDSEKGFVDAVGFSSDFVLETDKQSDAIRRAITFYTAFREQLALTQLNLKDLKDAFSGQIQAAGALVRSGTVNLQGNIALTSDTQKANQLQFLNTIIRTNKTLAELENDRIAAEEKKNKLTREYEKETVGGREATVETTQALREAEQSLVRINDKIAESNNAFKAITGEAVAFVRQMEELRLVEERRTLELKNQLDILRAQNNVARVQADNALDNLKDQIQASKQKLNVELAAVRGDAGVKKLERDKASLEIEIAKIARAKELLEVQQQQRDIQAETLKLGFAASAQRQTAPIERRLGFINQFEGLGTEGIRQQLDFRKQIIELESALAQTVVDYNNSAQKNVEAAQKDVESANKKILAAKKEEQIVAKRAQIEAARIQADFELQRTANANRVSALTREDSLADVQETAAITQLQAQKSIQDLELKVLEERAKQIAAQAEIFSSHAKAIAEIFAKDQAFRAVQLKDPTLAINSPGFNSQVEDLTKEFTKGLTSAITIGTNYRSEVTKIGSSQQQIFDVQKAAITDATKAGKTLRAEERKGIFAENKLQEQIKDAKLGALGLESGAAKDRAKDAVTAAEDEKELARLRLDQRNQELKNERNRLKQQKDSQEAQLRLLREIADLSANQGAQIAFDFVKNIRDNVGKSLQDLGQAILDGTITLKNFAIGARDLFVKILRDLGTSIFQRLVVEPIQNFLVNALSEPILKFFGISIDSPLKDNTTALTTLRGSIDTLNTTIAGGAAAGRPNSQQTTSTPTSQTAQAAQQAQGFGDRLKELGVNFQTVGTVAATTFAATLAATRDWRKAFLYTVISTFSTMITQIASKQLFGSAVGGARGAFGGIFGGIGNWVSGLFNSSTPTGVMPTASGPLYSAAGGPVRQMAAGGYAGLRDRVPALLEPGEFVIRRPAAMAIGPQNLQQMNATGQVGPSNVMVNVNNQGTSQEVIGTPKVSVNGRDMIIDIVVKDIQNNGPIRKTLRGM